VTDVAVIDTPAAVVELGRLERNLARWQEYCDRTGLAARPHVKTHKSAEIARRQLALGAVGLTCQKLGEAETMVDAGCADVLVAYNIVGAAKLERLGALVARAAVSVTVDDERLLPDLDTASRGNGELGVLVDCDTGLGRTGVATPEAAVELAVAIARHGALRFGGFLTYPTLAGSVEFLARAKALAERRGLSAACVSAGGTPTMWDAERLRPTVTEYRAGVYAFHDRKTVAAGAATLDEVALTVRATVVSRPARDRAVLDAGSKALGAEAAFEGSFGLVLEAPRSPVVRLDEEHAYVSLADGEELDLGEPVRVVPNHACVVANLFDAYVVERAREPVGRWPVDARGRSQ
jgi:D-serine deaminase-like pyridoxal phosphate-dependent protein